MKSASKELAKTISKTLKQNSPIIMMGMGISGFVMAGISIGTNTPKAIQLLEEKKKELEVDDLTPVETVKTVWICYLPAATLMVLSAAAIICGQSVSLRRNAMLATAYAFSEKTFDDYRKKVVDVVGDKKERDIRDEIVKENAREIKPISNNVVETGKGTTLCFEPMTATRFRSDGDHIRKAKNILCEQILKDGYASLNDFFELLGLEEASKSVMGQEYGWHIQGGLPDIYLTSDINEVDEPYLIIDYVTRPTYNYDM